MTVSLSPPEQFGRYRILSKIGEGGMGTVYLAEDTQLGRQVALKVPHFRAGDSATASQRFYREAKMAAGVNHANLCGVYDVGEHAGFLYLTMPFVEGQPLARLIDSERPWEPRQAAELIRRLARAIHVMHQRGVIHRDLKPSNVMIRPDGEPVLMDFGLARSFEGNDRRLTKLGAQVGSPSYMSPEQVMGLGDNLGPATDIYSLGVMLYQLVTGKLPFEGPVAAVYGQVLKAEPPLPSSLCPGLDRELETICVKAMAKKPADRFISMIAFADILQQFLSKGSTPHVALPPAPGTSGDASLLRLTCPQCGKNLRLTPDMHGKSIRCPSCKGRISASETQGISLTEAPPVVATNIAPGNLPIASQARAGSGTAPEALRPAIPLRPLVPPQHQGTARNPTVPASPAEVPHTTPRRSRAWLIVGLSAIAALAVAGAIVAIVANSPDSESRSSGKDSAHAKDEKTTEEGNREKQSPDRLPPPPRASLLVKDLSGIEIQQGKAGLLDVAIERTNCPGPVKLEVTGLPNGVAFAAQPIPKDADRGQVLITVEPGTKIGTATITVRAVAGGAQADIQAFVTIAAPPKPMLKVLAVEDVSLEPGQKKTVHLTIERENFPGSIKLLAMAPTGVIVEAPDLPADSAVARLTITIDKDALAGPKTIVVNADPGGVAALRTIGVTVVPPKVVKPDPAKSGPTKESQAAIAGGLRWLALHQALDGHWSLDKFPDHARTDLKATSYAKDNSMGRGQTNDIAGTAFGLLPFLVAGIDHKTATSEVDKVYCDTVRRGLDYLRRKQFSDGSFSATGVTLGNGMYAHALATIAMCEAYRRNSDPLFRTAAQKAITYLINSQDPTGGGWRYLPRTPGDTSVTGWVVQALAAAKEAGLNMPNNVYVLANRFLDSVENKQPGGFGYVAGSGSTPAMSAAGCLSRLLVRQPQEAVPDSQLLKAVEQIKKAPPQTARSLYALHYSHQVMYQIGGDDWLLWELGDGKKPGVRDWLVNRQEKDGSWNPAGDAHADVGGRIMHTSLALQALQVYQRSKLIKAQGGQ